MKINNLSRLGKFIKKIRKHPVTTIIITLILIYLVITSILHAEQFSLTNVLTIAWLSKESGGAIIGEL